MAVYDILNVDEAEEWGMTEDEEYAAIMAGFGVSPKIDLSPEDMFFFNMTAGNAPKIDNMLYWLKHEMSLYDFIGECNMVIKDKGGAVSRFVLGKTMVRYYLQMMHLTRFTTAGGELDLDKTLTLFVEHQAVKKIINAIKDPCTN